MPCFEIFKSITVALSKEQPCLYEVAAFSIAHNGQNEDNRIMTTVVRINSKDGIVLVSDSQGTSDGDGMKDLNSSKLLSINESIGICVASDVGHIRVSVDEMRKYIERNIFKFV